MKDLSKDAKVNCEMFLNELEEFTADGLSGAMPEQLRARMTEALRAHGARCTSCEEALQDFAETRKALEQMRTGLPEAGSWFTVRVMNAIAAEEEEIEEKKEGVWISVRRMAPRLVAFAAVLLVLGGSWAIEVRRADQAHRPAARPAESLFEGTPSTAINDDIVADTYYEEQAP